MSENENPASVGPLVGGDSEIAGRDDGTHSTANVSQANEKHASDLKVSDAALAFIRQWFADTESPVFLCSLANDSNDPNEPVERHLSTRDDAKVEVFLTKWDRPGRGLFFCVSTIREGMPRNRETVAETPGLWADVDFKDVIDDRETVLRRVKGLRLPPSLIVSSGNGLHLYWRFKEPLTLNGIDGADTIERVESTLKLLADLVGGDMKVTHVASLMRLPGTHNSKHGEWKDVEVIK
jgi:hypothetical protein